MLLLLDAFSLLIGHLDHTKWDSLLEGFRDDHEILLLLIFQLRGNVVERCRTSCEQVLIENWRALPENAPQAMSRISAWDSSHCESLHIRSNFVGVLKEFLSIDLVGQNLTTNWSVEIVNFLSFLTLKLIEIFSFCNELEELHFLISSARGKIEVLRDLAIQMKLHLSYKGKFESSWWCFIGFLKSHRRGFLVRVCIVSSARVGWWGLEDRLKLNWVESQRLRCWLRDRPIEDENKTSYGVKLDLLVCFIGELKIVDLLKAVIGCQAFTLAHDNLCKTQPLKICFRRCTFWISAKTTLWLSTRSLSEQNVAPFESRWLILGSFEGLLIPFTPLSGKLKQRKAFRALKEMLRWGLFYLFVFFVLVIAQYNIVLEPVFNFIAIFFLPSLPIVFFAPWGCIHHYWTWWWEGWVV